MTVAEVQSSVQEATTPRNEDSDTGMRAGFAVSEDFFPEAEALRQAIDEHFSNPHRHDTQRHQIWNYWFVPGLYTYLRTLPEKVFGPELAQRFFDHLRRYAFETYGLGKAHWPYLSLYVAGCQQGLHNDARNGRLGYVYSLTRWDKRSFSGGETLLLKEDPWSETGTVAKPKAGVGFYHLVPQQFNQLLVFDDRIPHAVPRIEGTMDPCAGRFAVHGHFAESGITIDGGLGGAEITSALVRIITDLKHRQEKARDRHHGLVVLRATIDPSGRSGPAVILLDRVLPLRRDVPVFESSTLTDLLSGYRFPPTDVPSRITVPIVFGDPVT